MRRGWGVAAAGALVAATSHAQPTAPPCRPIADGARVRARDPVTGTSHVGAALGWHTPRPRLVTARGDTLALDPSQRTWASAGRTARRTWQGAVVGWGAGVAAVLADCGLARTCGEQNPLPLLGTVLGAVVGRQLKRERWTRVTPAQSLACATR